MKRNIYNFSIYLLSVYLLVLTAMPCIDAHQDVEEQRIEMADHSSKHQSKDHQQTESDSCSPFCTCQCCACPVVFTEATIVFEPFHFPIKHNTAIPTSNVHQGYSRIWQPPKLV